jgi:Ca-activated chloride channel family protein
MRREFRIWAPRHAPLMIVAATIIVLLTAMPFAGEWRDLWATPDQWGAWRLTRGENAAAAGAFLDPVWRGVALMRAGRFQQAADSFAQSDSATARYDRGNALVMLGQYPDAVAEYDKALALRPGWPDASANRHLAQLRAESFAKLQGEPADEAHAPTDEAYRSNRKREAQEKSDAVAADAMSDAAIRFLWLRRVETKPGDFLRARFGYQLAHSAPEAAP